MIDLEKYEKDLKEWKSKVDQANKRCEELNKDTTTLNKMGGIGYHVQYARVICNAPKNKMTYEQSLILYNQHLQGGRRNPEMAAQICETWNNGELKTNWLGGKGYHVKDGRICHNSK